MSRLFSHYEAVDTYRAGGHMLRSRECRRWEILGPFPVCITAVSPRQRLPLTTARIRRRSPADYSKSAGMPKEITVGEQERRAGPTPLFARRDALARRHPIREHPGTDARVSRVAGAAPVPAAARVRRSAGRGVASFAAPPTPVQSATRVQPPPAAKLIVRRGKRAEYYGFPSVATVANGDEPIVDRRRAAGGRSRVSHRRQKPPIGAALRPGSGSPRT